MPDNKQIKDGLGNLFTQRMRDISPQADGSVQRSMFYSTLYPVDYGPGGIYSHVGYSQVIAGSLPANSILYSFRWGASAMLAAIRRLRMTAWTGTTAFTAQATAKFELFVARNFTAPDTGGTSINLAGDTNQLRTSMSAAQAQIEIANTGGLIAGTRTLDTAPLNLQLVSVPLTLATPFTQPAMVLFDATQGEHPLILALNEGFEIIASVPPIGNWNFAVMLDWAEVQNY